MLAVFVAPVPAGAQVQTPSNMLVVGTITTTGSVSLATNDLVQAINVSNSRIEGQGTVAGEQGGFSLEMSRTTDFNGTSLALRLAKTDGRLFTLVNPDGTQFRFAYNGGFFPVQVSFQLRVGAVIPVAPPPTTPAPVTPPTTPTPTLPEGPLVVGPGCASAEMDVNADGRCDELDIELIKEYISGRTRTIGRRDVNSDGVVNTRDVIDLIRSINQSRRPKPPNRRETAGQ